MWIQDAEWLPQVDELCHALAVRLGSNLQISMLTLVNCCQGLITLDKEALAVQTIRFYLHECLSALPDIFSKPRPTMVEICLTCLNSQPVKAPSTTHSPDTLHTPFLQYYLMGSACDQGALGLREIFSRNS